jgi:Tol biopolymer transport system component
VAFESSATDLVADDTNGATDIFVHDRSTSTTTRVSLDSVGTQGNLNSSNPSISSDGRYAAFESSATDLVLSDTNGTTDIFVHDRNTGTTARASLDSGGAQGNLHSTNPTISSDGLLVTFESSSTNLVMNDTNGTTDIFVHDRNTGTTARVSLDSSGVQGNLNSNNPSISSDGLLVTFESISTNLVPNDTNGAVDIFVHNRNTSATARVSLDSDGAQGNLHSTNSSISSDGIFVAFESRSTNLVPNDTNGAADVFVTPLN